MPDTISSEAKEIISKSVKAFTNLLKEFPKGAADEFFYDASTLKKIGNVGDVLNEMATLEETGSESLKESFKILSQLMDELPKDSSDEFLYDREIHRKVEGARGTIAKLQNIIS